MLQTAPLYWAELNLSVYDVQLLFNQILQLAQNTTLNRICDFGHHYNLADMLVLVVMYCLNCGILGPIVLILRFAACSKAYILSIINQEMSQNVKQDITSDSYIHILYCTAISRQKAS